MNRELPFRRVKVASGDDGACAREVLLLAPSRGRGGGIERYLQTVQSAFDDAGIRSHRLHLMRPGLFGHQALLAEAAATLANSKGPARLIIGHRALLPVAAVLARRYPVLGTSVICHGSDVWGKAEGLRGRLEGWLMGRRGVRLVAASGFTAGTLLPRGLATVLPPGLSRPWFGQLVAAADRVSTGIDATEHAGIEVMTAFRLAEWRGKGLPQLTDAIKSLGRSDIRLTVCGSGEPSPELLAHVGAYPWCTLQPKLTDVALASRFAHSDLFVLATRTRAGRRPCGEGFGLVLLEAQVAGTPVVGPAHGGSSAAYLDGVTGATPKDESAQALAQALSELTRRPGLLPEMGRQSAIWARARFAPDRYAALAVDRLL